MALGYRKGLEKFIKPLETNCKFVFWFCVDKNLLKLSQNVIVGIVYIPPVNSVYSSDDAFGEVEVEFQRFCQTTGTSNIVMVGDYNSRIASLPDFYDDYTPDDFL